MLDLRTNQENDRNSELGKDIPVGFQALVLTRELTWDWERIQMERNVNGKDCSWFSNNNRVTL